MEKLGAERARIAAALGPMIRQPNYEVGPEFVARFIEADAGQRALLRAVAARRPRHVRSRRLYRRAAARAPASRKSRTSACAPMPSPSASSAIAARRIAASPTTAGTSTRSRSAAERLRRHRARPALLDSTACLPLGLPAGRGLNDQNNGRRGVDGVASGRRVRARRGAYRACLPAVLVAVLCALALAGCNTARTGMRHSLAAQPRGATVAFEFDRRPAAAQFSDSWCRTSTTRRSAPARGGVARAAIGLSRARLSRPPKSPKARRTDFLGLGRLRRRRSSARCASAARRPCKGRHSDAWQRPMTPCCAGSRKPASSSSPLSDLGRSRARHADAERGAVRAGDASPEAAGIFRIFRRKPTRMPTRRAGRCRRGRDRAVPLPRRRPAPAAPPAATLSWPTAPQRN